MKNKLFQNYEHLYDSIKFLGTRGILVFFHFVWVHLFFLNQEKDGVYEFLDLKFKYKNTVSLTELFADIFTLSPYYFFSKNPKPAIVDIGANIGDSLLYFKFLYPNSAVHAFEPNPQAFELLKENVNLNKFNDVHVYREAVSNSLGELSLYSMDKGDSRQSTSDRKFLEKVSKESRKVMTFRAKQVKLSTKKEVAKLKVIDLLKIDAEGHESKIISDLYSSKMLNKVQHVILEYHFMSKLTENSLDNIVSKLQDSGFELSFFNYYRYLLNTTDHAGFLIHASRV